MGPSAADMTSLSALLEWQKPIYHTPVVLGIKHFKRELAINFPGLKKSTRNRFIRAFKKRAWMEFQGITKGRGTFPTHPKYGKDVKVTSSGIQGAEYEIKVTHGKRHKEK